MFTDRSIILEINQPIYNPTYQIHGVTINANKSTCKFGESVIPGTSKSRKCTLVISDKGKGKRILTINCHDKKHQPQIFTQDIMIVPYIPI